MRSRVGLLAIVLLSAPWTGAAAQVQFERVGYRLTSIGERVTVVARSPSARGSAIRWHIADSSIATVSQSGVVISRRPGYTKLWAIAGDDSASTLIVVNQWAAKFEFVPAIVRFDAIGARMPFKVRVRDAAGYVINDRNRALACRSVNDRVVALSAGELSARAHGVTYVRCTDRGIADSVRVEVLPRAVRAQIVDRLTIANKTVGDTFRIRLSAFDRMGDEIRDAQATWASLNPGIMSVDPLTGMARSVGPGAVKIVGQVGDATDTVAINVAPGFGFTITTTSGDTSSGFDAIRVPTLTLSSLYLMVGDTGRITASAKDAAGNVISNPRLTSRSMDTSVVNAVNTRSGLGWVGRKTGVTFIVVQYGNIIDSLQVSVRAKATAAPTAGNRASIVAFQRPRYDTVAANRLYKQRRDSAARAIQRASIVKNTNGRMVGVSAVAGQVAHSARLSRFVSESRTGLLYGGNAALAPVEWLMATADFRTGSLSTGRALGEEMTVTEAEAQVVFSPAPWFGFGGGYVTRAERTELATQRWTFPRVLAMTRFPFVGGKVTSVTGLSILPGATYSGYADSTGTLIKPEALSFAGEAGLEVRTGVFSAAVSYYVERFTFPVLAGETRRDQFSALRVRVGLQLGR